MNTLNNNVRASSRREVFDILSSCMSGGTTPDMEQVESMYKYFMPKPTKAVKTPEQWAAQACATKDIRESLHYLHVVSGVMYASDGHRMHFRPTEMGDGVYHPVTLAPILNCPKAPEFSRIIPKAGEYKSYRLEDCEEQFVEKYKRMQVSIGMVVLDKKYLSQATNNAKVVTLYINGPTDPVRGLCDFGEFVIMPIRR